MRAVRLKAHGGVEHLELEENVAQQALKPEEARIRVKHCGLNHLDLWLRAGNTGDRLTLPRIPGSDIVGIVEEIGAEVDHIKCGDAIMIYPGSGCGHCSDCAAGRETLCRKFSIIGYHRDGGYANFVQTKAMHCIRIPDHHLHKWAAVPVAYVTAWNALVTKANVKPLETVAIWGGAGGLGMAAITIAHGLGARVLAIVGSESKKRFLEETIDFDGEIIVRNEEILDKVRKLTNKRGVDIVLDSAGGATWHKSLKMLARGGRLVSCGVTTGARAEVDLRYIFGKQLTVTGSWMGDRPDMLRVVQFIQADDARLPYIHKRLPLEKAGEAQQLLEEGKHVGKIVIDL